MKKINSGQALRQCSGQAPMSISGQALLLVLLGMAAVLVLILSIVSRSLTDITITKKGEDFSRAFSAAEAGVEKALLLGSGSFSGDLGEGTTYSGSVSGIADGEAYYNIGDLKAGESATVWFVSHSDDGTLTCSGKPCFTGTEMGICWGNAGVSSGSETTPAIEVSIYYDSSASKAVNSQDYSDVKVARLTFDPYSGRVPGNSFGSGLFSGCTLGSQDYAFRTGQINFASLSTPIGCASQNGCLLFAKIKSFYNTNENQIVGADVTGDTLPSQGKKVAVTGKAGEASSKVEAIRPFKEPIAFFESAVFTMGGSGLVKN